MRKEFEKRRSFVFKELMAIKGVTCPKPMGAFYAFPNVACYYGKKYKNYTIDDSNTLAEYLLHDAKVAVIPGAAFGSNNHIRLSYATSMENLQQGLKRLHKGLTKLTPGER
jgi:aspartate aminotransferase